MENELANSKQQTIEDGVGPRYHRIYTVRFLGGPEVRAHLMDKLLTDINSFSPQLLARFEPQTDGKRKLRVGDDIQIHISGPWNGPVRVAEVGENSLKLVTLEGHLEAGEINFSFEQQGEEVIFKIESEARSKDRLVDLCYDKIPISRVAQTEMWTNFCESVVDEAARIRDPEQKLHISEKYVKLVTERCDEQTGKCELI